MAYLAGIVLLILVTSDLTLGQRKHGRTLPVAADVKPGLNFDCPEEFGYYPHPGDCTQYYVCVFGGALLESCTGGLMYSHELQTCDWPRNVGCDVAPESATTPSATYSSSSSGRVPETKVRYTHPPPPPPPPAQPAAVVTSRGQPRQLQHNQQELIKQKQQQQLYVDAEDALPPAEEIENDRQQRVYRGQPSTIGQVQKDRDGIRHHTNSIPSSSNGVEKIGVISFGTQQQAYHDYRELTDVDNFLTNDMTLKRQKRQTKSSRHHRFETFRQHSPKYQYPQSSPSLSNTSNNPKLNSGNQYEVTQESETSDVNATQLTPNLKIANKTNNAPQLNKTRHNNYRNVHHNLQTQNSDYYVPSTEFPLQTLRESTTRINVRAPDVTSSSTETVLGAYKPRLTNQQVQLRQPYIKDVKGREPNPIFKIHNYNPTDNNIHQLKHLIDALTSFRNLQLYLRENHYNYNKHIEKKLPLTPNNKAINPSIINYPNISLIQNRPEFQSLFPNDTNIQKIATNTSLKYEALESTKSEVIKKLPNSTNFDDTDYYYYDDDVEETTKKLIIQPETTRYPPYNKSLPTYPKRPPFPSTIRITGKITPFSGLQISTIRLKSDNYRPSRPLTSGPRIQNYAPYQTNNPRRVENLSNRPVESYSTSRPRQTYNSSQYDSSRYDPYYDLYEEIDPDLYKNVEYTQNYNNEPKTSQQTYKSSTSPSQVVIQDKTPKRGNAGYNQNSYSTSQDVYRPQTYNKENSYSQEEDQGIYQQTSKQTFRGDQNELNYIEEATTSKRIVSIKTTVPTPRQFSTQKNRVSSRLPNSAESNEVQTVSPHLQLIGSSGFLHTTIIPNDTQITSNTDKPFLNFLEKISESSIISKPVPFALQDVVTITPKPSFHYVTKLSKSTSELSTSRPFVECKNINCKIIAPTTYSPSRSFLKSLLSPTLTNKTLFADSSNSEFDTTIPKNTYTTPEINSTLLSENTLDEKEVIVENITNPNPILYFPTRTSRVNTALKSIVSFGGLQRQYTKCTNNQTPTDKCKKLNKKRVNNRGRGSSHYSNSAPEESYTVNRGTPPTRSRPTLKPSTSIVSKASEFIDIYKYPPRRPESIYPQPQPDKTAAKCRKDVCLLPDCSCGGKEIPGNLDVRDVPQMVLLTFDDAVNDLNMGYYSQLFENGRVNPNGCPIAATFYVSHEWTDYSQVQNLYADGHEMASHTVSHSFGEQFSQKKWTKEIAGQREILSAYGGVRLEDVRGMRAPFLSVGGNKMFKMLYDSNFTYDSSLPVYENKPPSWPYTLDYKLFHDCMIPPCPTRSYPGVWEVPMVMWQDLNGGRCSMGDACSNPPEADGVFKMLMKNFERHYTTNRAPFGLFYHAAWFTQPHHKEGFIQFLDTINAMNDVWLLTNWQAIQWVRDPTPNSRLNSFQPFGCDYPERPKRCNNPKVCNLWHKTGVRYMRTCQPCPDIYPWTGNTGIRSSRIDNEIEDK